MLLKFKSSKGMFYTYINPQFVAYVAETLSSITGDKIATIGFSGGGYVLVDDADRDAHTRIIDAMDKINLPTVLVEYKE